MNVTKSRVSEVNHTTLDKNRPVSNIDQVSTKDQSTKKLKSWFLADTDMEEQTEDAFDEPMQRVN